MFDPERAIALTLKGMIYFVSKKLRFSEKFITGKNDEKKSGDTFFV